MKSIILSPSVVRFNLVLCLTSSMVSLVSYTTHAQTSAQEQSLQMESTVKAGAQFVDVSKGLPWLQDNATQIFSLVTEVQYIQNKTSKTLDIKSDFPRPLKSEDCEKFDAQNKYSNYFYYLHVEELKKDQAPYSNWFEGTKLDGQVVKKTIAFCFAN